MKQIELINNLKFIYNFNFFIVDLISLYEEQLDIFSNEDMVSILSLSRNNLKNNEINTENLYLKKENIIDFLEKESNFYYIVKVLELLEEKNKYTDILNSLKNKYEEKKLKEETENLKNMETQQLEEKLKDLEDKNSLLTLLALNEGI